MQGQLIYLTNNEENSMGSKIYFNIYGARKTRNQHGEKVNFNPYLTPCVILI